MRLANGALLLLYLLAGAAAAEVQFDGSTGGPAGILRGDIAIGEVDGRLTTSADALLHSFAIFNVGANESVSFTHTTASVRNIIARVTGADASSIAGALNADANLWLLNPNGVMIGPDAAINVNGAFKFNTRIGPTAALVMEDGSFVSVDSNLNTLTVGSPVDFGFTSDLPEDPLERVQADPTLGTTVSASASGTGNDFTITGGTAAGVNLFHSFERFSVFNGDRAVFIDGSANPYANVVSRVTGESNTFITGLVETSGSGLAGAAFWFLNPNGIFIGNGAVFDVAKSLNLISARAITNGAGAMFTADPSSSSLFPDNPAGFVTSTGPVKVSDFFFTQAGLASNGVSDDLLITGSEVIFERSGIGLNADVFADGSNLFLISPSDDGYVSIADTILFTASSTGASAGSISVGSARLDVQNSLLRIDNPLAAVSSNIQLITAQSANLMDSTFLIAAAPDAGGAVNMQGIGGLPTQELRLSRMAIGTPSMFLSANDAVMEDSQLLAFRTVSIDGVDFTSLRNNILLQNADPLLAPTFQVALSGSASWVDTSLQAPLVAVSADQVDLTRTQVSAQTLLEIDGLAQLAPGLAAVNANDVRLTDSAIIAVGTVDSPNGGGVSLSGASTAVLVGSTVNVTAGGTANSVPVLILGGRVDLTDTQILGSSAGTGRGAPIQLQALDDLTLNSTEILSEGVTGGFGNIGINGRNVTIENGSVISASTGSSFASPTSPDDLAGVFIGAAETLRIADSAIAAATLGAADAPRVSILAQRVRIAGSALISPSFGSGAAGVINIAADSSDRASVEIVDGTMINTLTAADGLGGQINILSTHDILIDGEDTLIGTDTVGSQDAGSIFVFAGSQMAGNLTISGAAQLTSQSTGSGNSGEIGLTAIGGVITLSGLDTRQTTDIRTDARTATGGNITINGINTLIGFTRIEASAGGQGSGGDINLLANNLALTQTTVLATAEGGNGGRILFTPFQNVDPTSTVEQGRIEILTDAPANRDSIFLFSSESALSADSRTGQSGSVVIAAPDTGINSALTPRDARLNNDVNIRRDPCDPATSERQSTFYIRSQGGQEFDPGQYLASEVDGVCR